MTLLELRETTRIFIRHILLKGISKDLTMVIVKNAVREVKQMYKLGEFAEDCGTQLEFDFEFAPSHNGTEQTKKQQDFQTHLDALIATKEEAYEFIQKAKFNNAFNDISNALEEKEEKEEEKV